MAHILLIFFLLVFQVQEPPPQKTAKELFDSGLVRLQKQDYDGAIADMTKVIEMDPRHADAIFIRGQCFYLKGDREKALLDYDKVIELAPTARGVERVYNIRSVLRLLKGDVDGALQDLEKAVELNPNYADSFSNRGVTRSLKGDHAGAAADYERALELNPNLLTAYINRGILRFERQNLEGAMSDINRALVLDPNVAKPYVDRAVLHTLAGEIDSALADLKKALAIDAASVSEKDPGIASSPFKRLQGFISANPTNARAYQARGIIRLVQGRRDEATKDFTKSVELDPKLQPEIDKLLSLTFSLV